MNDTSLIGRTLAGRFKITGYIGEGGMATVYRGEWDGEPHEVALKVMSPELARDQKFVRRFRREAKAAAMLKHPNTVSIVEFGVDGELVYLAMECVEGKDLSFLLHKDRRISEARAARILIQVCAALGEAHKNNIIHRDLKPDNIMLVGEAGAERVKVLDFGIAKILDEAPDKALDPRAEPPSSTRSLLTRVGTIVGTPAYMSPEQGRAEPVDARTDVYSCGVLLYELLTGRVPFDGETPMQVVMRHVNEPPMPPGQLVPMHAGLESTIMKALAKFGPQRHQTADELAVELTNLLPELSTEKRFRESARGAPEAAAPAPPAPAPAPARAPARAPAPPADDGDDESNSEPPTMVKPPEMPKVPAPARVPQPTPPIDDDDDDAPTGIVNVPPVAAPRAAPFPTLELGLPDDLEIPDAPSSSPGTDSGAVPTPRQSPPPKPAEHPLASTKMSEPAAPAAPPPAAPPPAAAPPAAAPPAARAAAPAAAFPPPAPARHAPPGAGTPPDDDDDDVRTLVADPKLPARAPVGPTTTLPLGASKVAPAALDPKATLPLTSAAKQGAAEVRAEIAKEAHVSPAAKSAAAPAKAHHPFADTIASPTGPDAPTPPSVPRPPLPSEPSEPTMPSKPSKALAEDLAQNLEPTPTPANIPPPKPLPTAAKPAPKLGGAPILVTPGASGLDSTQRVPTEPGAPGGISQAASIEAPRAEVIPAQLSPYADEPKVKIESAAEQLPKASPRAPTELRAKRPAALPAPALWKPKSKTRPKWMAPVAVALGVLIGAGVFAAVVFLVERLGK